MAKNEYVIYKCVAEKNKKRSERIIKIPSFWCVDLLGVALSTLSNDEVIKITTLYECGGYSFDFHNKNYYLGCEFRELEDPKLEFILHDINKNEVHFKCEKIGIDVVKNNINRKTPIVVSCNDVIDFEKEMKMYFTIECEKFMYE